MLLLPMQRGGSYGDDNVEKTCLSVKTRIATTAYIIMQTKNKGEIKCFNFVQLKYSSLIEEYSS